MRKLGFLNPLTYLYLFLFFLHAQAHSFEKSKDQEEAELISLKGNYQIEVIPVYYGEKIIHLFPSIQIIDFYKNFLEYNKNNYEIDFSTYLMQKDLWKRISLSKESTYYMPLEKRTQFEVYIQNHTLYQGEFPLRSGKNIFLIDSEWKFYAIKPSKRGRQGRIHHSTLSEGLPVIAAGKINIDKKTRNITLSNASGHYKPPPKNLDRVIQWLEMSGFECSVLSDETDEGTPQKHIRKMILRPNYTPFE